MIVYRISRNFLIQILILIVVVAVAFLVLVLPVADFVRYNAFCGDAARGRGSVCFAVRVASGRGEKL
jgi:hypothetical protein